MKFEPVGPNQIYEILLNKFKYQHDAWAHLGYSRSDLPQ